MRRIMRRLACLAALALLLAQALLDGAHRPGPQRHLVRVSELPGYLSEAIVRGGPVGVEGQRRQELAAGRLPLTDLLQGDAQLLVIVRRAAVERDGPAQQGHGALQVRLRRIPGEGASQGEGILGVVRIACQRRLELLDRLIHPLVAQRRTPQQPARSRCLRLGL